MPTLHSLKDARRIARRRLPRIIFDFIDGAAGEERAHQRNQGDFARVLLQPRALVNVTRRHLRHTFFGGEWQSPFGVAPMGMCSLAWPHADKLLGEAAARHAIPLALSTMASCTIERMREIAGANAWFQLAVGESREHAAHLLRRAQDANYENLLLTVDAPHVAWRPRDARNGFQVPFRIGARQFMDFAMHPRWSLATLMAGRPKPANTDLPHGERGFDRYQGRDALDWDGLSELRKQWPHRLMVKGILSPADAVRAKQLGADGVYVSNHGGRQLDAAPSALSMLPLIRRAVGDGYPLAFDGGVQSGEDMIKALALGADFVFLGRAFLFALGADQARGLDRLIEILRAQMLSGMAQIGATEVAELNAAHIAPDWQSARREWQLP